MNTPVTNKVTPPLWVQMAFSSIRTRRGGMILIAMSLLFSVYCIPWATLFSSMTWLENVFLIDDWSWLAMMIPVIIWYGLSFRWMDQNAGWEQ